MQPRGGERLRGVQSGLPNESEHRAGRGVSCGAEHLHRISSGRREHLRFEEREHRLLGGGAKFQHRKDHVAEHLHRLQQRRAERLQHRVGRQHQRLLHAQHRDRQRFDRGGRPRGREPTQHRSGQQHLQRGATESVDLSESGWAAFSERPERLHQSVRRAQRGGGKGGVGGRRLAAGRAHSNDEGHLHEENASVGQHALDS